MVTSKDILNSFGKEANIVKAVALYLGAEVRENQEVNLHINWHYFRLNVTPKVAWLVLSTVKS